MTGLVKTVMSTHPYERYVFLDRDGVINVERGDYTVSRDEWEWAPGALEGLKYLREHGIGAIVITNQACIAKGTQTDEGLAELHEYMRSEIASHGGDLTAVYHCPHQTSDGCRCRKPEPGMVLQAGEDYRIDLSSAFFIGDTARDMETARRAGTKSILLMNDWNAYPTGDTGPVDYTAKSLLEAAKIVEQGVHHDNRNPI
jgi:D-glycero-D-manno-heptose 1,7-bisphosphate phosphatase